jgi:RNA polymerase sigma factor (sigma-70 family)
VTETVTALAKEPNNQALWLSLFNKLRPSVFYAAFRACANRETAAEMTQAAFERFLRYEEVQNFESDAQLGAYLRQIARRLTRDEFGRLARNLKLEALGKVPSAHSADLRDIESDISLLLDDLSPADRVLLVDILEGKTIGEMAVTRRISYSAAGVRIHRLKERISSKYSGL